ncbi:hypothetical protein JOS77_25455 [Chromobacterium haemolyticum]|nr:hypothetical protein JOS77_25455 [Chromobacterium haemolyticum]
MNFIVIGRGQKEPVAVFGREAVYLRADRWNDYSFVTMFYLSMHDKNGDYHEFGNIKIGFSGQTIDQLTSEKIGEAFNALPVGFFSLGMDVNYYYKKLMSLPEGVRKEILTSLRDVVADSEALSTALNEDVFNVSLLRTVSISVVNNQFARVLAGGAPLTDFKFVYNRSVQNCVIDLSFDVVAESKPSTNIHALIGRNGVGKTTILNDMILSVLCDKSAKGKLFEKTGLMEVVDKDYFSNLVSVSFSAFDSFSPPKGQTNPVQGSVIIILV